MRYLANLALLAALSLCAGCASGPLTVDVTVAVDTQSIAYHVDPDGTLTATSGSGMVGSGGKKLLDKKLSDKEMAALKQAVVNSGFFTADSTLSFGSGPSVSADISLGVMQNRLHGSPGDSASLKKICRQLNTYLPKPLQVPLDQTASGQKEDMFAQ